MFGKINRSLTIDDILKKTTEVDILSYYFGVTKIPCIIKSPLREDRHPSFGFYTTDGSKVYFTDFAKGDRGGTFDLLSKYFNIPIDEVINKIYDDLHLFGTNNNVKVWKVKDEKKPLHRSTDLQCKVRNWRKYDLLFWQKYGITKQWLEFGDIYPISHIIITKGGNKINIKADKYAYVYVERKDEKVSLKIYQPYNIKYKWSNKHDSSVWDLWDKLPKEGEFLIITSSRKDALCLWENVGIPSTSLQAESYLPKPQVINELKRRFKNIFVLYDNDYKAEENHGLILGNQFAEAYDLIHIFIPEEYKSKDPSDLVKNHGTQKLNKVIMDLIKEYL